MKFWLNENKRFVRIVRIRLGLPGYLAFGIEFLPGDRPLGPFTQSVLGASLRARSLPDPRAPIQALQIWRGNG
jgi:hypothetical protein